MRYHAVPEGPPRNGDWLAVARWLLGLTQAELAERLGVRQATISRWESGDRPITRRTLLQVEALFAQPRTPPSPNPPD